MSYKLTLEIDGGNAAFEDNPGEFARILHKIAGQIEDYPNKAHGSIRDINGNRCGQCVVKELED